MVNPNINLPATGLPNDRNPRTGHLEAGDQLLMHIQPSAVVEGMIRGREGKIREQTTERTEESGEKVLEIWGGSLRQEIGVDAPVRHRVTIIERSF